MFEFLTQKFSSIFSGLTKKVVLSESDIKGALDKVKEALIEADVPYDLVTTFCQEVSQEALGAKVLKSLKPTEQLIKVVHDKLSSFLGGQAVANFQFQLPSTILIMGLQGSGKTTTIAKLAYWALLESQKRGKKRDILVASVDFYRPAAIDQLEILAQQVGISFYRAKNTDPVKAAQEIQKYAQNQAFELLFLDTAGRLQVDQQMMQELQEIERELKPKHKILVLDAMTGQESLSVAKSFMQTVGFEGAILTKMDSQTRAGAAFAFAYELKKPILFVGTGEKKEDLELFHPDRLASRILGMGDLTTLLEKANVAIKESEQEQLYKSMMEGKFSLEDFAKQLEMMNKLGSLSSIMKYIPGLPQFQMTPEMVQKAELEAKKFKAIISSMTRKERIMPQILDGSRKKRVAQGSGVQVAEVNQLLQRFEQSKQYVKLLKKFGKFPG